MTPTLDLDALTLAAGAHDEGDVMCVMEAVAYVAGEPWSDHPECASKVIGAFLRAWNDALDDTDRQMLKPLIPRLVGTAASVEVEDARAWMACDWLVRTFTPAWLRAARLTEDADALEALPTLTSTELVDQALPVIRGAQKRAAAVQDAARDAAAWDAARAAARDAAAGAAAVRAAAVRAAARAAAAWDAVRAAARAAVGDALAPTVTALQQSALDLLDRMIALTEVPA